MNVMRKVLLAICVSCFLLIGGGGGQAQTNTVSEPLGISPQKQAEAAHHTDRLDWGTLYSTLLGGFLSAVGGFAAVGLAHLLAARHKRRSDGEFSQNVLRAIRFELESLSALYREGIDSRLEPLKDGDILNVRFALTEDWLTVFNQNAGNLGAIEGSISKQIITVYSLLKGLIEEYRINNGLILALEELDVARRRDAWDQIARQRHQFLHGSAVQQAKKIRELDQALKCAYAKLLQAFDSRSIR